MPREKFLEYWDDLTWISEQSTLIDITAVLALYVD